MRAKKEDISESYGRAEDFVKFYSQQESGEIKYAKFTTREQIEKELSIRRSIIEKILMSPLSLN